MNHYLVTELTVLKQTVASERSNSLHSEFVKLSDPTRSVAKFLASVTSGNAVTNLQMKHYRTNFT